MASNEFSTRARPLGERTFKSLPLSSEESPISWPKPLMASGPQKDHRGGMACPFFKRNPVLHKKCGVYGMRHLSDVRQHIQRRHRQPLYCPTCGEVFDDHGPQDEHVRKGYCAPAESSAAVPEGVTDEQFAHMRSMTLGRIQSDSERWHALWDILFPETPRTASPYLSGLEDPTALQWFLCCLGLDGQDPVLDFIDGRNNPEPNQQQEILSQLRVVGAGILRVLQGYSANQDPTTPYQPYLVLFSGNQPSPATLAHGSTPQLSAAAIWAAQLLTKPTADASSIGDSGISVRSGFAPPHGSISAWNSDAGTNLEAIIHTDDRNLLRGRFQYMEVLLRLLEEVTNQIDLTMERDESLCKDFADWVAKSTTQDHFRQIGSFNERRCQMKPKTLSPAILQLYPPQYTDDQILAHPNDDTLLPQAMTPGAALHLRDQGTQVPNQGPKISRIAQRETSVRSSSTEQYGTRNSSAVAFSNEGRHRDDGSPLPIADDSDASSRSSSSLTMSESDGDEISPGFPQCLVAIEPVVLHEVIHSWRASDVAMRAGSEGTVTSTGNSGTTLSNSSDVQRGKSKGEQTLKRRRDDDQISEDEDEEPLGRKRRNQGAGSDTIRLACPFQKLDPERHPLCGITSRCIGWKRISHVKQHLSRTHYKPYCPRCKQEFQTPAERNRHSEGQSAVELCEVRPLDMSTRLDDEVAEQLRGRVSKTLSTPDQWFSIWDLIFPGVPRPLTCTIDDFDIPIEVQGLLASLNTRGTQTIVRVLHEHNLTFLSTQNGITEEVQDNFIHHVLQQAIAQIVDEWRRLRSQLTADAATRQPGARLWPLSTTADTGSTTSNRPPTLIAGLESASESRASAAPVDQTPTETIEQMDYWSVPDVSSQPYNDMEASAGNWNWDNFTTLFSGGTAALDVEDHHECYMHGHSTGAEKLSSKCTCKPLPDIP